MQFHIDILIHDTRYKVQDRYSIAFCMIMIWNANGKS